MTEQQIKLYKQLISELARRTAEIRGASQLPEREKDATLMSALTMLIAQVANQLAIDPEVVLKCQVEALAMVYDLHIAFIGPDEAALFEERSKGNVH